MTLRILGPNAQWTNATNLSQCSQRYRDGHSCTDASSKGTKEDQNPPLEFTMDIAAKCLKTYFNIDSATMCLKLQLSWEV